MSGLCTSFWRLWYGLFPPPSVHTREEALKRAAEFGLEREVATAMEHGCTPDEALQEWDICPL